MTEYQKPPERYDGLRLHQNENTGGCSPKVMERLSRLSAREIASYPPYGAATEACASHFGVSADRVVLTNGLDEGIMALSVTFLRPSQDGVVAEAVVPEPAFEIYRYHTPVAGGRLCQVMPRPDLHVDLGDVMAAIGPRTRVVFLSSPNNPTGLSVSLDTVRTIAERMTGQGVVLVDEAYADFSRRSFIPELPSIPNVVIGRTFSKAYGLAGLRIGCLVGAPEVLAPIRRAVPVYSVNIAAVTAMMAALEDPDYVAAYLGQVDESRDLVYEACDRLGLKYWRSDANFVLVRIGDRATALVRDAAERGIFLRDRSGEPGCAGCVRISTGIVEHTRRCLGVLEEILCAGR
jgi:histidinol-phosphate aminotransferase